MIRTLLIITGASIVLCIAALSGAAAIGGNDLASHNWEWTFRDGDEHHTVSFAEPEDDSPAVTRTLAWAGGDRLEIDAPAEVVFTQGTKVEVRATGPQSLVHRLRFVNGRLALEDLPLDSDGAQSVRQGWVSMRWNSKTYGPSDKLQVFITAPSVRSFELNSGTDLSIRDYNQPTLTVRVNGAGDVAAVGETGAVTVDLSGSGEVDLTALRTTDATVDLNGSGDVRVGPTGTARIDISGSGDVQLTRRPANLQQTLSGSGDIDQN
ncbi:GIN domain-containing protein [Brevundimonas sp.]|uniref:GIN domain-containing protein n=1 Tax=Brevundimonas sp. TaxID=1871086 RepID=UPI003F6EE81C